ncbi:uncharacterized protein LOC144648311 [Oculina patagonica]
MLASTKGSFKDPNFQDDKSTSVQTKPLEQEKQGRNKEEKESGRANAAHVSNRALLALVIASFLISLAVLLLTLLMLFGKIGDRCHFSARDEVIPTSPTSLTTNSTLEKNITNLQLALMEHLDDFAELNKKVITSMFAL